MAGETIVQKTDPELWKLVFTLLGIFLGSALTFLSNSYFQNIKDKEIQKRMLSVLFGELLNIKQHYFYASRLLPENPLTTDDYLTLKTATYGEFLFTGKQLSEVGFLTDDNIADLMQLSLKIRNTDFTIEYVMEQLKKNKQDFTPALDLIKSRMGYVEIVTTRLIEDLSSKHKNLVDTSNEESQ